MNRDMTSDSSKMTWLTLVSVHHSNGLGSPPPLFALSFLQTAEVLIEKENIDGEEFQQIILSSQAEQYLKNDEPSQTIPYQKAASA